MDIKYLEEFREVQKDIKLNLKMYVLYRVEF